MIVAFSCMIILFCLRVSDLISYKRILKLHTFVETKGAKLVRGGKQQLHEGQSFQKVKMALVNISQLLGDSDSEHHCLDVIGCIQH